MTRFIIFFIVHCIVMFLCCPQKRDKAFTYFSCIIVLGFLWGIEVGILHAINQVKSAIPFFVTIPVLFFQYYFLCFMFIKLPAPLITATGIVHIIMFLFIVI